MPIHFYKGVFRGSYSGQDINNVFWYRDDGSLPFSGQPYFGGEDLAYQLKTEIWPLMRPLLPAGYRLVTIDATVHDETFAPLTGTPLVYPVDEVGSYASADSVGPALCAIVSFSVSPVYNFIPVNKPPKRGYLALGPLPEDAVDNTGLLAAGYRTGSAMTDFLTKLFDPLTNLAPPGMFYPVRVSARMILGVFNFGGYSEIVDAVCRPRASFRRSRLPEA